MMDAPIEEWRQAWSSCIADRDSCILIRSQNYCASGSLEIVFVECLVHHRDLHSFPTRRSSDLSKQVLSYLSYPPTRNNLGILKHSHYLRAISIVCRSIRSNNGSNQTITAGLRFLALQLIACYAPGRINSSIDFLGSASVHVSGPVAATFPRTPLIC